MLKKFLILTTLASLLLAGCSNSKNYKREIDGNEDYLKAPELKNLVVPPGLNVPERDNEYNVSRILMVSNVGKKVDIRPPTLPLSTIEGSEAIYKGGGITLDLPPDTNFWASIPEKFKFYGITMIRHTNKVIQTAPKAILLRDNDQLTFATYLLQRKLVNNREQIVMDTFLLSNKNQQITDVLEKQYHTSELFTMLMTPLPEDIDTFLEDGQGNKVKRIIKKEN